MSNSKATVEKHEVLLLGGDANSLSVARSLGKKNIKVSIAAPQNSLVAKSRFITNHFVIPPQMDRTEYFYDLLLNQDCIKSEAVVFACEDHSITVVAENKTELRKKYILDIQKPEHQLALLDKKQTLDLAKVAGCPAPKYWHVNTQEDVANAIPEITFPVLIKPLHSHLFQDAFVVKLFYADNKFSLLEQSQKVFEKGLKFMLCEFIPGPDNLLSSYYAYYSLQGERLFRFTKQIERRSPINFGLGSYHRTKWLPETAAMGEKFFTGINFRGLGNIEFKFDTRDKQLKVIESNARFTLAQELVTRSGIDMPYLIYQYLVNDERPQETSFKDDLTMLLPFRDLDAFRDLRKNKEITLVAWLKSLMRRHVYSYYELLDPKPFLFAFGREISTRVRWMLKSFCGFRKKPARND